MLKTHAKFLALTLITQAALICTNGHAQTQQHSAYASMSPIKEYVIPDEHAEIALARSAAPASISQAAEVMVLGTKGYTTASEGSNGFVCLVERGWGASTDDPEFWNPKVRAPICFNPAAARTYLPIYLMKTTWVLAGKSKTDISKAIATAFNLKKLPTIEPWAMCYMMSKQQYLSDQAMNWHPHLMFFVPGDATKSWGANLASSPVIAASDPEERVTIMLVWVGHWSDGTPAPASKP
jgi:hypothetical protein